MTPDRGNPEMGWGSEGNGSIGWPQDIPEEHQPAVGRPFAAAALRALRGTGIPLRGSPQSYVLKSGLDRFVSALYQLTNDYQTGP